MNNPTAFGGGAFAGMILFANGLISYILGKGNEGITIGLFLAICAVEAIAIGVAGIIGKKGQIEKVQIEKSKKKKKK